jgi:LacI family transcriptional regulator
LINIATRLRIRQLAGNMGYIPDAIAQSLTTGQTKTIGFVITTLADPFFASLVEGIEGIASDAGISLFINVSNNDPDREIQVIETFQRRRVDGIIVAASRLSERQMTRLMGIQIPVVFINQQTRIDAESSIHTITVDDRQGARLAVEHLLSLGHTKIGFLGLGSHFQSNAARLAGYRDALIEANVHILPERIQVIPPIEADQLGDIAAGSKGFAELIKKDISALFCYNDRAAIGSLQAAHQLGIQIPEDFSLVGFDDLEMAQYVTPPLTTINQHRREMGSLAMKMVLQLMAGQPAENIVIQPDLTLRCSSSTNFKKR